MRTLLNYRYSATDDQGKKSEVQEGPVRLCRAPRVD